MHTHHTTQVSSLSRALGISLAAFSMFVLGYTASRVYFSQASQQNSGETASFVIPHQAFLWSDLAN